MKFAFAAVLAALGMTDAKRVSQKKKDLLRKAVPVNRDGSRRELNGEFEINGNFNIEFNDCLSLTWQNEDALEEGLVDLTASGVITPQTSFAIFNIFNDNPDYYSNGDDLWMLPLGSWIEATADGDSEDKEDYCDACGDSYDYCNPEEEEADDGGRKLKKRALTEKVVKHREAMSAIMGKRRFLDGGYQEYVDCYTCEDKGCFDEDDEDDENNNYCDEDAYVNGCTFDDETVQEFMQEAACRASGLTEYGADGEEFELMAGLMCNAAGTGVEMALFADEDCSLYYSTKSFSRDMVGTYTYAILGEAAAQIMQPYISTIDCMAREYLELGNDDGNDDDQDQEENDGDAPEASETCQNIIKEALDVATCGGEYQENQNDDDDDQENDGNYYPAVWYTYDFLDGNEPEEEDVCFYIKDLEGSYSAKHVFNDNANDGGGNFFDYESARNSSDGSGNGGMVFGIVVLVAVGVAAVAGIAQYMQKKDSKKVPLVGNTDGAMA